MADMHHVWTHDLVFDTTFDSRRLKFLTLVDEFTRECLAIKVERRLPARAIIEVLEQVFSRRGVPEYLRSDNGPEFIAKAIQKWLNDRQVKTHYIDPGSPWQNAYGESFIAALPCGLSSLSGGAKDRQRQCDRPVTVVDASKAPSIRSRPAPRRLAATGAGVGEVSGRLYVSCPRCAHTGVNYKNSGPPLATGV